MPYGGFVVKKRMRGPRARTTDRRLLRCGHADRYNGQPRHRHQSSPGVRPNSDGRAFAERCFAFSQILGSSGASEYKVTYRSALTGGGEQSWYSKPPKTRFDFSTTASGQTSVVSIYSLPDGTFMCFGGTGTTSQCIGMTGLDTALQQNPAALFQQTMIQHPEQFNAVPTETRQIAGQRAQCFDVKSATPVGAVTDGRFCYSRRASCCRRHSGQTSARWTWRRPVS